MTTYYLSGPMRGQDDHGFPAFFEAADHLRGFNDSAVVSPAEMSIDRVLAEAGMPPSRSHAKDFYGSRDWFMSRLAGIPRGELLAADGRAVIDADAVVLLPGWEESEGSRWEVAIAQGLGKSIFEYRPTKWPLPIVPLSINIADQQDPPSVFWDETAHIADPVRVADPSGAVKDDGQKVRMDLLPSKPLWAIAEVLGFGAMKYADHNWRKGFKWSRMYGALLRHLTAWADGESVDQETGKSHLWHAGCDLLFLIEFEMTRTGTDDRYKPEEA